MINIRLSIFSICCFSLANLFGAVVCTLQPDGSWICSGDGGAPGGGSVVTNVVGVCTNCTAISPSECEALKIEADNYLTIIADGRDSAESAISSARDLLNEIRLEGEEFMLDSSLNGAISGSQYSDYPQSEYFTPNNSQTAAAQRYGAVNGIANYFNAISPQLDQIDSNLQVAGDGVENVSVGLSASYELLREIDCSSCTASFDGDPLQTNAPPSSGVTCPCDEQLKAFNKLLKDDFLPRIKSIDNNVKHLTNLVTIAREQLDVVKEGMHNITNLLTRLDDYVLDDFSNRVVQIRYDVNFIASNLAQRVKQTESFISTNYWMAVNYLDNDEQPVEMASLHDKLIDEGNTEGNTFDFGEFQKLPWFTRIEFLLLKLNGIFVHTNQNSDAGVSSAEQNKQQIENASSSFVAGVNTDAKSGFDRVSSSFGSFFNSFNAAVSSSGQQVNEIQFLSNFIGDRPLTMTIDPDVVDAARTITSLLWTVLFSFVLFKLIFYFWIFFSDLIRWWIDQTQGFVK